MPLIVPKVRARRFVRKVRGGSQAHLIEADDGHCYVVKFRNNPHGARILINEVISAFLLQEMALDTPAVAAVEIDGAFLAGNPRVCLASRRQGAIPVTPGLHFGSQYPGIADESAIYDFLPDAMLHRLHNRSSFFGALVFDKWVSNADGRQAIFFRLQAPRQGDGNSRWISQFIDNGHAFQGADWTFSDSAVQGVYARLAIYGRYVSMLKFRPWIEMVRNLSWELFEEIFAALPHSWIAGEEGALQHLLRRLYRRRALLPELVRESIGWMRRAETDSLTAKQSYIVCSRWLEIARPSHVSG